MLHSHPQPEARRRPRDGTIHRRTQPGTYRLVQPDTRRSVQAVHRNELSYMDKPEMDAVLAAPDRRTEQGRRDHALLLFLYNSGARVTEAASLRIGDLNLIPNHLGDVQLRGKGRKIRRCPLWPATVNALLALVRNRSPDEPVFLNRLGDAITRHGIHWMLQIG